MQWKLSNSSLARQSIRDTYFFAKAWQWRYEKEWRAIHPTSGVKPAPFRITAVYFGLRCDPAVQTSVVKLFANSYSQIKFYDIFPLEDSSRLKRRLVDTDRIKACGLRTSVLFEFKDISIDESTGA